MDPIHHQTISESGHTLQQTQHWDKPMHDQDHTFNTTLNNQQRDMRCGGSLNRTKSEGPHTIATRQHLEFPIAYRVFGQERRLCKVTPLFSLCYGDRILPLLRL